MAERLIVVEERRSFIERQIAEHISMVRQNTPDSPVATTELWGKQFPRGRAGIPASRGLHPSMLIMKLTDFLRDTPGMPHELANGRLTEELDTIEKASRLQAVVPTRTPAYCPGCPHRDSSSALLEIRKNLLNSSLHAEAVQEGPHGPRRPWRHRLLHHDDVRTQQTPHA